MLIEYLAHQLPFVSYATGQVYETLKNEIPTCFCTTFSERDWLQRIDTLHLVNRQKLQVCYNENFSVENYLEKCLKIYNHILHS